MYETAQTLSETTIRESLQSLNFSPATISHLAQVDPKSLYWTLRNGDSSQELCPQDRSRLRALLMAASLIEKLRRDFELPFQVNKPRCAINHIAPILSILEREEVWGIFMNIGGMIISTERLFLGGISSAAFDVRIILRRALLLNAASFILAHNHPSGRVEPSREDLRIYDMVKGAALTMELAQHDHIIVGVNKAYSMADCQTYTL